MITKTISHPTIKELNNEIIILRSYIIGLAGKDEEGEYRPEFVERVFSAATEKPTAFFSTAKEFLRQVQNA